jgi:DNA-binding CsgD family transcriptional regulator
MRTSLADEDRARGRGAKFPESGLPGTGEWTRSTRDVLIEMGDDMTIDGVRFEELRRLLRLIGDLRELPPGSPAQRMHVLDGLSQIVGAQVGIWVNVSGVERGHVVIDDAIERGWENERARRTFLDFVARGQGRVPDPTMGPLAQRMASGFVTCTRDQLLSDRDWYRSEHVQEYRRAADVDSCIYTGAIIDGRVAVCLSFHRPWGDRPFDARTRELVEIFHRETLWMHAQPATATLPPRQRQVLERLARGASEKQIADELSLSPHTVHDYVKALHRRFGASNRAQLLARTRQR